MTPRLPVATMLTTVAGALLVLSACSGDAGEGGGAAAPAPAGSAPPPGFASHELGGLTFSTPEAWQPVTSTPAPAAGDDLSELALRAPAPPDDPAPVALAVLDPTPARPAAQEVASLVTIKRDVQKVPDVVETPLSLAGFRTATVVSYDEELLTGQSQRTEVLVGELVDGSVVTLTVKGDEAEFRSSDLGAVVLSARGTQPG